MAPYAPRDIRLRGLRTAGPWTLQLNSVRHGELEEVPGQVDHDDRLLDGSPDWSTLDHAFFPLSWSAHG